MRDIDIETLALLELDVTNLCFCWRVVFLDEDEIGFTDATENMTIDGLLYESKSGMGIKNSFVQQSDLSVSNTDALCILSSDTIQHTDLLSGRYDKAKLYVFITDYTNPTWMVKVMYGTLGEVTINQQSATIELRSLTNQLKQRVGYECGAYCPFSLFDAKCGVSDLTYRQPGEVVNVSSENEFRGDISADDRYYQYGKIQWLTGLNNGLYSKVRDFVSSEFYLWEDLPYPITIGDTFYAWPGCDKTYATCKAKFNNHRFGGFPHIPGSDFMISSPDAPVSD